MLNRVKLNWSQHGIKVASGGQELESEVESKATGQFLVQ